MTTDVSLSEALKSAGQTQSVDIAPGLLARVPHRFRDCFGEHPAIIVADENTFAIAGQAVVDAFHFSGHECLEPFIFLEHQLSAEHDYVIQLEASLKQHDVIPVAVGAGTINDLTKLASHRLERPYMSVATAASMDGYTAFGASITLQGSKQTFNCPAPIAVIADLDILCAAPPEMNAAGYADLLAKTTAGADWLLADALGAEGVDQAAWNIVQGSLPKALTNPAGVCNAEPEAIRQLTEGLILSGLAMQRARSSRPASGAEHQFSHLWDMQHHVHNGQAPSHGFKVGIGTLAVTALYECLLEEPLEQLEVDYCCARWRDINWETRIRSLFADPQLLSVASKETEAKSCDAQDLRRHLEKLRAAWPELRERLRRQLLPLKELERRLKAVGAPTQPEEIGISRANLRQSFWQAFFIRRRFTVLDLAVRTARLDHCLEKIFGEKQ